MRHNLTPQVNAGRVDLHVEVIELLSRQESKYTEEQIRAFKALQKKQSKYILFVKR